MAAPFRAALQSFVGIGGSKEMANNSPILSSIACELVFNDLRDSERRHAKQMETKAAHIQCGVLKSVAKRFPVPPESKIELSAADWAVKLQGKTLKQNVFESGRITDGQMGLDTTGLTKQKKALYTKPHILQQRLGLTRVMKLNIDSQYWFHLLHLQSKRLLLLMFALSVVPFLMYKEWQVCRALLVF